MKKAIISIATIIGISLILTLIYYQNSEPTLPTDQLVQQNKTPTNATRTRAITTNRGGNREAWLFPSK